MSAKKEKHMHTITLEVDETDWERLGKLARDFDCTDRAELMRQSLNLTQRFVTNNKRLPDDTNFALKTIERLRRFSAEGCHLRIIHPDGKLSAINLIPEKQ